MIFWVITFFITSFMLLYIYGGYLYLLKLVCLIQRKKLHSPSRLAQGETGYQAWTPLVTIHFPAYNEGENVRGKIENLLELDYPPDKIEIIMISDGSTDNTVEVARQVAAQHLDRDIRIEEFKGNVGRAHAQNVAAKTAKYDILLATDAETRFPPRLLKELMAPFAHPLVGVVGGVVVYLSQDSAIGESYSKYRSMETSMRSHETLLGTGVKTDGPCVAYLKKLWQEIEDWEDVDQVISIFAKKKGYLTVQADRAICYDKANKTKTQELRQRSRMTRKALLSTFGRWGIRDCLRYPGFSFALISHKVVRFFSPFFLVSWLTSFLCLGIGYDLDGELVILILLSFVVLLLGQLMHIKFLKSLGEYLVSFLYANLAFAIGVIEWGRGNKEGHYQPTRLD